MAAGDKLMERMTQSIIIDAQPALYQDVLAAAAAIGATTITLNSADPDWAWVIAGAVLFINTGNDMERATVLSKAASVVTLKKPLKKAHLIGATVTAAVAYDTGDPIQGGVSTNVSMATVDVFTAMQALPIHSKNGYATAVTSFAFPYFSPIVFAWATGQAISRVTGTGANATPFHMVTNGSEFNAAGDRVHVSVGVLKDGSVVMIESWGIRADFSGIGGALSRGTVEQVAVKFTSTAGMLVSNHVPDFTVSTTLRVDKNRIFDFLEEAGVFADSGTATTATTAPTAGSLTLIVASATGIVVGKILEVDTGGDVEHVMVHSIATLTVTLKTPFQKAHANGVAVKVMNNTRYAAIAEGGVTFGVTGSLVEIKAADFRFPIGYGNGSVAITMTFPVLGITQAVLADAMGIPTADIDVANGNTLLHNNIGSRSIVGMYAKGKLANGDTVYVIASGNAVNVSSVGAIFNNTGGNDPVAITVKPGAGFRIFHGAGI